MRVFAVGCTHNRHNELNVPDVDMIIHTGDAVSSIDPYRNLKEMNDFLLWFSTLPIKHKVYVPGNHCTSMNLSLIHI